MNATSERNHRPPRPRCLRGAASGVLTASIVLATALAPSTSPVLAQATPDARSVVETVLEKRAERLAGVENYTVVQTLSGAEATLYFERAEVDGVPVFRIVPPHEYEGEALEKAGLGGGAGGVGSAGGAASAGDAGLPPGVLPPLLQNLPLPGGSALPAALPAGLPLADGLPGPEGLPGGVLGAATGGLQQQLAQKGMEGLMKLATPGSDGAVEEALLSVRGLEDLASTGRLDGTEVVDGVECFVLRTDRIEDSELARQMGGGTDFALRSLTIWIDTQEYVPRRTVATGEVTLDGRPQEMTLEILEQDYRRVEGMLEPFRRVIRIPGMGAMLAAEDPEKAEQIHRDMQENLAKMKEMEEMLARMPPEQRRMVEAQMGPALARMEQLAESGIGDTETVIEVEEMRVNAGPPTPFGTGYVLAELDASMDMQMVARAGPAADASGRSAGWTIQLLGASEGYGGGIVQIAVPEALPTAGEIFGNAGASFRWEDGKEAQFVAPEGGARITITSNDGRRVAGEFSFEASGQIRKAGDAWEGRTVVNGHFEAPLPPAMPGIPPGGAGPSAAGDAGFPADRLVVRLRVAEEAMTGVKTSGELVAALREHLTVDLAMPLNEPVTVFLRGYAGDRDGSAPGFHFGYCGLSLRRAGLEPLDGVPYADVLRQSHPDDELCMDEDEWDEKAEWAKLREALEVGLTQSSDGFRPPAEPGQLPLRVAAVHSVDATDWELLERFRGPLVELEPDPGFASSSDSDWEQPEGFGYDLGLLVILLEPGGSDSE